MNRLHQWRVNHALAVRAAFGLLLFAFTGIAFAQETAPAISAGDTAWVLISTGLVLLMTPGLAFFYGGLVRTKNVLGTMMQSIAAMGVIGVLWFLGVYSLCFGPDLGGLIGNLRFALLLGVDGAANPAYSKTIPHLAFMAYQGMFAIITPALIGGAVAERMKFKSYLWFIALWIILVYAPVCHWIWGDGGWMRKLGVLDFAGGTVVHISSGVSALVACLLMGKRREFPREPILPHNLPFVVLGGGLLWFGWFGFNGGSSLAADSLACHALVATHISAAAAAVTWMFHDWIHYGKPTALGTVSGAVAGLAGVTQAAGYVAPWAAFLIGIASALCCASFVRWRTHKGIDDSLDAFGVHGISGTLGAILTGIFASAVVNPSIGFGGLIEGHPGRIVTQLMAVAVTYLYAGGVTFFILKVLDGTLGLRVRDEDEMLGLDQTQHGEAGYSE